MYRIQKNVCFSVLTKHKFCKYGWKGLKNIDKIESEVIADSERILSKLQDEKL